MPATYSKTVIEIEIERQKKKEKITEHTIKSILEDSSISRWGCQNWV